MFPLVEVGEHLLCSPREELSLHVPSASGAPRPVCLLIPSVSGVGQDR